MNAETVPAKFARSLLTLVAERECDYSALLENAGIDFDPMQLESDHRLSINALQYSRLYRQVVSLSGDEAIGFNLGLSVTPGAFSMMCYCILGCENLEQALQRIHEFCRTFFQPDIQVMIECKYNATSFGYVKTGIKKQRLFVGTEDIYSLRLWHCFFCWLTGRSIKLLAVKFSGCAPDSAAKCEKYRRLFNCDIQYQCAREQIVFDSSHLSSSLVHTEQSLKEFLRTAPYQLMVLDTDSNAVSITARVRSLIGHNFSQGIPCIDQIAGILNMSASTLRRRLRGEGTAFQQLKDECRRDASIKYLSDPQLPITAVAAMMGFTDPSAFHRSFKKWTATTPGEFRRAVKRRGP